MLVNCSKFVLLYIVDTSNQQQGQEYSPMLAIQEEGTRGAQEKVFEVPKPFELPEKSELVTLFSHPFHTVYHVEDQPVTSEYQRFSKILASKGVTIEMMVGLVHTSAACVEYHISEVLHSISVIIDDAGLVFLAENVCKWLPAVVEQALIMMHMVCACIYLYTYKMYVDSICKTLHYSLTQIFGHYPCIA